MKIEKIALVLLLTLNIFMALWVVREIKNAMQKETTSPLTGQIEALEREVKDSKEKREGIEKAIDSLRKAKQENTPQRIIKRQKQRYDTKISTIDRLDSIEQYRMLSRWLDSLTGSQPK